MKLNCWEFLGCGREPGGTNEHELGTCPASIEKKMDGIHGGTNAGRSCWVVAGTFCKGEVTGTFAEKFESCIQCKFFQKVRQEEGDRLLRTVILEDKLSRED